MTTEGRAEGKPSEVKPEGNQEVKPVAGGQPVEVELPDGTKVTADELRAGYMKDADYRKKTAELAEERRRVTEERDNIRRMQATPTPVARSPLASQGAWGGDSEGEEPDPVNVLAQEVVSLKTFIARDYLTREIDRLERKYPDMDKKAVFDACWSNPNAVIENEAERSHGEVTRRVTERTAQVKPPANLDDYWKANPKAKEEYDRRLIEDYNAKKVQKETASTGGGSGSSSGETFHEEEPKATTYKDATSKLRERLKSKDDSF